MKRITNHNQSVESWQATLRNTPERLRPQKRFSESGTSSLNTTSFTRTRQADISVPQNIRFFPSDPRKDNPSLCISKKYEADLEDAEVIQKPRITSVGDGRESSSEHPYKLKTAYQLKRASLSNSKLNKMSSESRRGLFVVGASKLKTELEYCRAVNPANRVYYVNHKLNEKGEGEPLEEEDISR